MLCYVSQIVCIQHDMHDMKTEKWEMIWYEWKMIAGLYLIMLKMEKYWDLMHWGYPYSITRVRTRTLIGRRIIIMFYIMLSWWLLILTGVQHKELQSMLARQRKGPSGVRTDWWVHTRMYGLCVEYMVQIQTTC